MHKKQAAFFLLLSLVFSACGQADITKSENIADIVQTTPLAEGTTVQEINEGADIIFSAIRYVLDYPDCRDGKGNIKQDFIPDGACNTLIFDPATNSLAAPQHLFSLDIESDVVVQLTNTNCHYSSGQVIDRTTLMVHARCPENEQVSLGSNTADLSDLFILHLDTGEMQCLTYGKGLQAINNPDFSPVTEQIVFSAHQGDFSQGNHLYSIDQDGNLDQLTANPEFMDFDCAWSQDGQLIAFNRLPLPAFSQPSQVWIMDADGTGLQNITDGGENPQDEPPQDVYPVGLDADPDFSPDGSKLVFSRLVSSQANQPFGEWSLLQVNLATGEMTVLLYAYANMLPEWGPHGILFIRQVSAQNPADMRQGLMVWAEGSTTEIEPYPFNAFPMGAYSVNWIDR